MSATFLFPRASRLLSCSLLLLAGVLGGCKGTDYPRDPDNTLETVLATGEMTVAAVAHPPWVILDEDAPPTGAEAALVRAFAEELGVEIEWRRLSAFDALEGMSQDELDLVIGGFTQKSVGPYAGAAPTYAYFTETLLIAARPESAVPSKLDGETVFVPSDVIADGLIRDRGAVPTGQMDEGVNLAALPHWRVQGLGLLPTAMQLRHDKHVMVVPQGENAWLMRLERFLRSHAADMGERLREHEG